MAAREVLGRGLRWNIGNGKRVRIWANSWIPTPNSFIVSPRPQNFEGDLVENLLYREIRGWDLNLVKDIFLPYEAESILSIPISHSFPDDALVWAWTQRSSFTVRNAYHVAYNWLVEGRRRTEGGEELNPWKRREFWKAIWGLNCPSKVQHFMWKSCKNILPTNYNLSLCKVNMVDECVLCGKVESSGHALWDCWLAMFVEQAI